MSKNRPKKCKACDGAGEVVIPYMSSIDSSRKYRRCYECKGSGTNPDRWTSDYANARYLSNNDTVSEPVCISNIRVWREEAKGSEDMLWRVQHGAYGSRWIEIDKRLYVSDTHLKSIRRKAWDMGLDEVATVVDMLLKLESYPILDENDESEAEHEEQQEHWESYGRAELHRIVEDMLEHAQEECPINDGQFIEHRHFGFIDLTLLDELYGALCEAAEFYPERIDSSAWNFGLDPDLRRGHGLGQIVVLLQERPWLIYREQKPQTLRDFIIDHQGEALDESVLVDIDIALERGELDAHIAGELLSKRESTPTQELP